MSEKESEALRVPLLDLALVSEGKKKDRPSKKTSEAGNKNNDGDNRVPQQEKKTMEQSQIIEAQKKQIADLTDAVNKLQRAPQQQPAAPVIDPMAFMMAQQMGMNPMAMLMGGANPMTMMQEQFKLQQLGQTAAARVKALGPAAPSSLQSAVLAQTFGVPVEYKPTPNGWETASSAFGVGIGVAGGVLAALGIAAATKLAVDALFGGGTTDPSAPTTTG